MTSSSYRWVADVEAALRAPCGSVFPLVRPDTADVLCHFERVLSWYGSPPRLPVPSDGTGLLSGLNPIVAFRDEFFPLANLYGRWTGRPVLVVRGWKEVIALTASTPDSMFFIGTRGSFACRDLLDFARSVRLRWGFLTAGDVPALSFSLAKLLARPNQVTRPWEHFDAIQFTRDAVSESGRFQPATGFRADDFPSAIQSGEWDMLSLHCHGDGAHAKVGPVVLCGIVGDIERDDKGRAIRGGGCVQTGDPFCKRGDFAGARVVPLRSLPVRDLCLFTCNGVSVAGDIYPSDSSFLLSAAQGYARTVLTTDRRVVFDRSTFQAVLGWMRSGASTAEAVEFLNGMYEHQFSARPFVLFGDPMIPAPMVQVHRTSAAAIEIPDDRLSTVIGPSPNAVIARAHSRVIVIRNGRSASLVDRSGEHRTFVNSVRFLRSRVARAQQLTAGIQTLFDVNSNAELRHNCDRLLELRNLLEQGFANGIRMVERTRVGVWDARIHDWIHTIGEILHLWDASLIAVMDQHALQNEPEVLLRDGYERHRRNRAGRCSRCDCSIQRETAYAGKVAGLYVLDCPVCGPHEVWENSLGRLRATLPRRVKRGDTVHLQLRLTGRWPRTPILPEKTHVLLHLKDTGRGIVPFRHNVLTAERMVRFAIPFDLASASEMHSVRIVAVRGISVAYIRLRTACVP